MLHRDFLLKLNTSLRIAAIRHSGSLTMNTHDGAWPPAVSRIARNIVAESAIEQCVAASIGDTTLRPWPGPFCNTFAPRLFRAAKRLSHAMPAFANLMGLWHR